MLILSRSSGSSVDDFLDTMVSVVSMVHEFPNTLLSYVISAAIHHIRSQGVQEKKVSMDYEAPQSGLNGEYLWAYCMVKRKRVGNNLQRFHSCVPHYGSSIELVSNLRGNRE